MKARYLPLIASAILVGCSPSSNRKNESIKGLMNAGLSANFTASSVYECDFPGAQTIDLPLYPDRPNSSSFHLKYQIVGNLKDDQTAIVFLPGGPGGTSMADYTNDKAREYMVQFGLSQDLPWILFDPRTSGCNRGEADVFPDDSLTSEYLAEDVLAVLKSLNIKKYMIFGHSYGTQWGTFVAGLAEQGHGPKPQFILFSGILGHGTADESFATKNLLQIQLEKLKSQMSPKALDIFNGQNPLGISSDLWTHFLTTGLYRAALPVEGKLTHELLQNLKLLESENSQVKEALIEKLKASPTPPPVKRDFSDRLYAKVDCHEFSPMDVSAIFSQGQLIADPDDHSCDQEKYDRPYDSAKLQTAAPIYYIAGTADPAAPYEGAYYHFENQKHSHRNFIKIDGGGHATIGNLFADCKEEMWNSMLKLEDFDMARCKTPHQLTIAPAQ